MIADCFFAQVTLLGFLCLISNFLLAVFYFPDLIGQVPWWMFLFWSSNIFLYQTFDNVDGKQVRAPDLNLQSTSCDANDNHMTIGA
jgi:hypothetical protein